MTIRPLESPDIPRWIDMRAALWPEEPHEELDRDGRASLVAESPLTVFVAVADGVPVGFIELDLRSYAEGCASSPVPYIEGWYVESAWRGHGTGGALMRAAIRSSAPTLKR